VVVLAVGLSLAVVEVEELLKMEPQQVELHNLVETEQLLQLLVHL
jgi:hypothetical protein